MMPLLDRHAILGKPEELLFMCCIDDPARIHGPLMNRNLDRHN
jgi:hypothetical protein